LASAPASLPALAANHQSQSNFLENPMSTIRSVDPGLVGVTPEKDRSSSCSFTFADGRRCRAPRSSAHPQLCYFHARKEAQAQAAEQIGRDTSYFFSGRYLSACDLSAALGRLFAAVAQGQVKPRTASTLAYLGQTLLQTIHLAEHEYAEAFGDDSWRRVVRSSINHNSRYLNQAPAQEAAGPADQAPQAASAGDQDPGSVASSN